MSGIHKGIVSAVIVLASTAISWAQAASTPATPAQGTITGTVAYRERMALPADAAIEVKLVDVSMQGGAPKSIATSVFAVAGQQVPISFQLQYNPADIDATHTYQLRANIMSKGRLMFTSTTIYPVITKGAPSQVAMMLQPVQATPAAAAGMKKLRDTHWNLVEVNGKPAVQGAGGREAHLELYKTGQLAGFTGCNNITGSYIAAVGGLQFTPGASTMMACPPPQTEQEQAFLAALKATTAYHINGETLELMNGEQVLAKFQARK